MHKSDAAKAKQLYAGLIADGHDSYDLRARLAQLAQTEDNARRGREAAVRRQEARPRAQLPVPGARASSTRSRARLPQALAELEHYAFLEQMELAPLKELVAEYGKLGELGQGASTYGEMAMFIAPHDPDILLALGRAYLETGDGAKALFTYDTMLAAQARAAPPRARPPRPRASALLAQGKKAEAKAALALAAKTEPENAEVLELKAKLK